MSAPSRPASATAQGIFTDATGQIFDGRFVAGAEAGGVTVLRSAGTYPVYNDCASASSPSAARTTTISASIR